MKTLFIYLCPNHFQTSIILQLRIKQYFLKYINGVKFVLQARKLGAFAFMSVKGVINLF